MGAKGVFFKGAVLAFNIVVAGKGKSLRRCFLACNVGLIYINVVFDHSLARMRKIIVVTTNDFGCKKMLTQNRVFCFKIHETQDADPFALMRLLESISMQFL